MGFNSAFKGLNLIPDVEVAWCTRDSGDDDDDDDGGGSEERTHSFNFLMSDSSEIASCSQALTERKQRQWPWWMTTAGTTRRTTTTETATTATTVILKCVLSHRRSQWPRGLRCRSAASHLLRLWVRILPGAWMPVCCECRVLSGRGLCDELITRPEESYRLWCVVLCDLETSRMGAPYIYVCVCVCVCVCVYIYIWH